ncbi:hypothetical protein OK16_00355, partial [Listeria monocytogenes]
MFLLEKADLAETAEYKQVSPKKIEQFIQLLKDFIFEMKGTLDFETAFVTGDGVSVKEIKPKEMQSKLMEGLFFCGEILDITGYMGG